MIMRRKIYDKLVDWKNFRKGKSALLIEGARRVGKSTLVKEFAKREYLSYLLIDFAHPLPTTIQTFENYRHDIGLLLSNLSMLYGTELKERKSLIVFDEIQKYPPARELIKYLVEDGRYDYIETGSLISIRSNVKDIQIPSEESRVSMFPMDFEEFLWACGDKVTYPYLLKHFSNREPLGQTLHRTVMEKFKTYMLTGGMPQAVFAYVEKHDLLAAEPEKRDILKIYAEDLHKIRAEDGGSKARLIFDDIPSRLSSRKKTFRPGVIKKGTSVKDYAEGILWLEESKICNICRKNVNPDISAGLNLDTETMKCYMGDTGLLLTVSFDDGLILKDEIARAFVKNKLTVNEGMLFENIVAQMLVSTGHRLYFTEFYEKNDNKHPCEVDFIIIRGKKIIPLEVKSGISTRHRSLDLLMEKYHSRIDEAFVIHGKDLRIDRKVIYIPVYMSGFL